MPKSLVTGAAGFIGSHIVDHLVDLGHEVVALDDLSGGFEENVNSNSRFVKGGVADYELLKELFEKENFDYVYHLAAYAAEGLSHFIRRFNYENNLIGSVNLINLSVVHKIKCFVFTSSIAVYGANQTPMVETLEPKPEDPYGISKYAVELDLRAAHEMFDLEYIIFRPHNVYGERQNIGDKYRNVIGIFMNRILRNEELIIFGDGEQTRAFSCIDDVAPVIAKSVNYENAYGEVFNVGADTPYTLNYLAKVVMESMGRTVNIRHDPARNEVKNAYSDHSKVRNYFDIIEPPVSLEVGVKKMADWVKKHGVRETSKFKNIEITDNFPLSWR